MKTYKEYLEELTLIAKALYPKEDTSFVVETIQARVHFLDFCMKKHEAESQRIRHIVAECLWLCLKELNAFSKRYLTPHTAKVGLGVHILYYTDRIPATIIKVTKMTITVQKDTILDGTKGEANDEKFFKRNPFGEVRTFHWSPKAHRFGQHAKGQVSCHMGRVFYLDREF